MRNRGAERGGLIVRLAGLVFLAVVALVLFFARFALMRAAGDWLVVSDSLQPSNAIIVLSGDDVNGDRAARAAQIYKAGWAPVVVASGTEIRTYLSEADLEMRDLESDGVPANAIVPLRQNALYTLQESRDLLQLCRAKHWTRVIVVTSNFHTRRARYIFQHVFPPSVQVRVSPSSDVNFHPGSWWETRQGMKTFARETAALCVAFWELHMSSLGAKAPQQPGSEAAKRDRRGGFQTRPPGLGERNGQSGCVNRYALTPGRARNPKVVLPKPALSCRVPTWQIGTVNSLPSRIFDPGLPPCEGVL
jgi:uncharacterized SAM-binding protein YcdF (DUF218 family)